MRFIKLLFFIFLLLLGVAFAILNRQTVSINYYIAAHELPLAVLLVLVLSAGVLIGMSLNTLRIWRLQWENRRLRSTQTQLQASESFVVPSKDKLC
jgi:putative membrane protein